MLDWTPQIQREQGVQRTFAYFDALLSGATSHGLHVRGSRALSRGTAALSSETGPSQGR